MFERLWVQIPATYTGLTWHLFTSICCKICIDVCLKLTENKRKRGRGWRDVVRSKNIFDPFSRASLWFHSKYSIWRFELFLFKLKKDSRSQCHKQILGGSPGLVVMGGASCSEGRGFESQHSLLDGHLVHSVLLWPDNPIGKDSLDSTLPCLWLRSIGYLLAKCRYKSY